MTIELTHPSVARALMPVSLPSAARVLAVTARPGQESADLGGLLQAFRRSGASLSLLCLTRGEGAGSEPGGARLEAARPWEVQVAAAILGVPQVAVANYRDGSLHHYRMSDLAARIERAIDEHSADLVLVIAPETGEIGDAAVARAAMSASLRAGLPTVGRTREGVSGSWEFNLGVDAGDFRAMQRSAASAHRTQEEELPGLLGKVDELGAVETMRWLVSPARVPAQRVRR